MVGALFLTATTQMDMSFSWLYSNGSFPMLSCPSEVFLVGANEVVDGTFCKLLITADSPQVMAGVVPGVVLDSPYHFGHVVIAAECGLAASLINPRLCTMRSWSDSHPSLVSSCQYNVSPVCDAEGVVYVGKIIALRGLFFACAVLVLLYAFVSFACLVKSRSELIPNRQRRLDVSRSLAEAGAKEMTRVIKNSLIPQNEGHQILPSLVAEAGSFRNKEPDSLIWRQQLSKSLGTEARARRKVALLFQKLRTGLIVCLVFFALTVGAMQLVLLMSPNNYFQSTVRSFASAILYYEVPLLLSWNNVYFWTDLLPVADLAIELFFAFLYGAVIVQWPLVPLKVPHLLKTRNLIRKGLETDFVQAAADGAVYADSVAVVLVCRESCSSDSRRVFFSKRLQHLLTMFPPESVFVVDSHPNSDCPVDPTWQTVHSVSPQIGFCFVPDCDSKLFALHWFNLIWLPYLIKSKNRPFFSHLLVLMAIDDEFSLPAMPLDVMIPRESLLLNADTLRAVHFPITAVSPGYSSRFLVPCQDVDFKLKALKQFAEYKMGTAAEAELAVAVWEREALVRALEGARTKDISPHQQLESCLAIAKLRGRNHIKSNPFSFVQTQVPAGLLELVSYRMRNNHAGEIIKAFAALIEILSPSSLCSMNSLIIKPALLLTTVAGGFCQIIRPWVIGSLVFRDPLAIALLAAVATVLIVFIELVLLVLLAKRPDLRAKWSFFAILSYPFYRGFSCWFIEIPVLFEYIMGGSVQNAALKPEKRFKDLKDVPACPPHHIVNWFTVWKADDETTGAENKNNDSCGFDDSLSSLGGFMSPRDARGA